MYSALFKYLLVIFLDTGMQCVLDVSVPKFMMQWGDTNKREGNAEAALKRQVAGIIKGDHFSTKPF